MFKGALDNIPDRVKVFLLSLTIMFCMISTVYANFYIGIDKVYTHIFYVPIILAGIWYRRKAIYVALGLGLFYIVACTVHDSIIDPDTILRFLIFLVVAGVVGSLSRARERFHSKELQAERAFRRVAKDLQLVLESTDEGIYTTDIEGRCTLINVAGARMLGYGTEEIPGRKMHQLIHHTRANGTPCPAEECCVSRSRITGVGCRISDDIFWRKDGTAFPVEYSSYPIISDEAVIGSVVAFRDITKRKQADEVRSRLAAIVESTDDAIIGTTLDGIVTTWNAGAERIYGYTAKEIIGRHISLTAPPDVKDEIAGILGRIRSGGRFEHYETVRRKKDGALINVSLTISPIVNNAGDITGASAIARDITENKRVERELQEAKAQAEMYNDLLSHDINNINQIGTGYLELALSAPNLDRGVRELLDRSLEALQNSSRLIHNVRKMQEMKATAGKLAPVDICPLLDEIRAEYSGARNGEVRIDLACGNHTRAMANDLLKEVFSNIVGNAIKHSAGPVHVGIASEEISLNNKTYCKVSVEDNGPGIPDDLKPKLFSRFQRGNTKASGRGLGLYLVKNLVEGYGGRVSVEDRVAGDPSKGSRFVIMLPASA
ncbi:MAG: sensory histidine kinase AtoS [Methanocella sp. PtaU1.Bin125]|nr:MAG: sensory histidine kinase AtoS [Methanocella sp. PtaU1.Bin125]